MAELRQQVFLGGVYLVLRQAIALVVSVVGVTILVRVIGPTNYGLFTGASSIAFVLGNVSTYGLDVYLVRREQALTKREYDQAFTLLAISAFFVTGAAFLLAPIVLRLLSESKFSPAVQVLVLSVPFTLLAAPALASLERALNYKTVAIIEMSGQFLYYGIALVLAFAGAGVWAPTAAYFSWQVWLLASTYVAARYRPSFVWRSPLVREMLGYGSSYSVATWLWQLRGLVNPLVVGHFVGPAAVGFVGLASRLVEVAAFVRTAAWRLSLAAFGRVQTDLERFRRVVQEAMGLQALAVGPVLALLGATGPWLIPLVFGDRWHPVVRVFPYVALGMIFQSVFSMETSVLYVLGRGRSVIPVHALHIALFAGGAALCVPRFGVVGYGYAEMIAIAGYLLLDRQLRRVFSVSYYDAIPWVVAFAPPLFALYLPGAWTPALWVPLVAVVLHPRQRGQIRRYYDYVRRRAESPSAVPA